MIIQDKDNHLSFYYYYYYKGLNYEYNRMVINRN